MARNKQIPARVVPVMVSTRSAKVELLKCAFCGREYEYDKKKRRGHTRTQCNSCVVNRRSDDVKKRAVEYKGGKCIICGYSKCKRALVFHHLGNEKKEFGFSGAHSRSWNSIKKELDKCVLLCANCHAEVHAGMHPLIAQLVESPAHNGVVLGSSPGGRTEEGEQNKRKVVGSSPTGCTKGTVQGKPASVISAGMVQR